MPSLRARLDRLEERLQHDDDMAESRAKPPPTPEYRAQFEALFLRFYNADTDDGRNTERVAVWERQMAGYTASANEVAAMRR